MTGPNLVLASGSTIRARLLRGCNLDPIIDPASIDETAIKDAMQAEDAPARDIVDTLADLKARKVSQRRPGAVVLGADQILVHDRRILDKPRSQAEAAEHLRRLRGQTHHLMSAAVIYLDAQPLWRAIGTAQLTMRDFTDTYLEAHVARHGDDLLATVGCYKLEEDGPGLFSAIRGDYFSALGLPLLEVLAFLRTREIAPE